MKISTIKAIAGSDQTPLKLGNIELDCYVLDTGNRVLSLRGMQKALGFTNDKASGTLLSGILKGDKSIDQSIIERLDNPIVFQRKGAGGTADKTHGYDATLLIDICDYFMQAKSSDRVLSEKMEIMAIQASIIIRSVAKVGIVALIDEATGYQYDRERDALQEILKAYIAEELLPWQKRFPDIFYKELFRLNGWDFTINGIKKRPSIVGKWTNTLIYKELPLGILDNLKEKTPISNSGNRLARYHQGLTLDIGEPNLTAQINKVITIFQVSDNMKDMWDYFRKMKKRQSGQTEMLFQFDDNGYTVDK